MKKHKSSYQKLFRATLVATMATGVLVAAVPTNAEAAKSFPDVKPAHHFYEGVLSLTERGVINGYEDGTFRPGENISRAHAAKIMALALGLDTKNVVDPGFKDIPKSHPYYEHIAALVNAGIIKGYEDNTFRPQGNLTRAHIAQMIVLGYDLEVEAFSNLPFKDINNKQWFASYIQTLLSNEITTGTTPTTFSPNAFVTRGQVVSFLNRSEKVAQKKGAEIINIVGDKIELSDGTFTLSADLQKVFNAENLAVLKDAKIKYTVKDGVIVAVSSIELNANGTVANNLTLDGQNATITSDITVNGDYISLRNLKVENVTLTTKAKHVNIDATVEELHVKTPNSEITLGTDAEIGNLIIPNGVSAKDIIQNYDNVKDKIKKINGKENSDADTPVGGGGGGGSSRTAAQKLLNQTILDQLENVNLDEDVLSIQPNRTVFTTTIKNEDATLGSFEAIAKPVYEAIQDNATVSNVTVSLNGRTFTTKSDFDNNIPFNVAIDKMLVEVNKAIKEKADQLGIPAEIEIDRNTKLGILKGERISFKVNGTIKDPDTNEDKAVTDTYTFVFQ